MSEEQLEVLKELSSQPFYGDMPFAYYADLISKLITEYNKEKEKNKKIKNAKLVICSRSNGKSAQQKMILEEYINKDKIREIIKEYKETNMDIYTFEVADRLEKLLEDQYE